MLVHWLTSMSFLFVINLSGSTSECNCTVTREFKKAYCHFETREKSTLQAGFWKDWKNCQEDLSIIELVGGKELRFGLGVLAQLSSLERVIVRNVSHVLVQKNSFTNLTSTSDILFEFIHCERLLLEEGSFKNSRGPIKARIESISQVVIPRATFTYLLSDLFISRVDKLQLRDEAFLLNNARDKQREPPLPKITLDRVKLEYFGRSTFRSSAKEIKIVNSIVREIKTDAFDAIQIEAIVFENSTIDLIAKGAFNDRTLVKRLAIINVTIQEIAPGALPFGSSQLIVEKSRINSIQKGAINITVAEVSLADNVFNRVHSMGVQLHKWNSITIINNTFKELDSEAFSAPFQPSSDLEQPSAAKEPEYNFTGNTIYKFGPRTFDFSIGDNVNIYVEDNNYAINCHCDMSSSLDNFITGPSVDSIVYETSSCKVDQGISRCYRLTEGYILMNNYTDQICKEFKKCEEVQRDAALPPVIPVITPVDDLTIHDEIERERLILGSILVIFVFGMLIVALVSFVKCIKDHNYCGKTRSILRSTASHVFPPSPSRDLTPTASAHSFSQYSVHEYAEVQGKKEAMRDDSPLEDKATQTLPEELTQELIESLREKLNDPSNYPEARDMIEHLYDLIKTEDSANKNETTSLNLEDLERDNTYEAIQRRRSEPAKQMCHMWTRAPSPDKLLPHAMYSKVIPPDVTRSPLVCEYLEPRDRHAHLYAVPNFPRVCDYAEPTDAAQHVYTELPNVPRNQMRPLPRPS